MCSFVKCINLSKSDSHINYEAISKIGGHLFLGWPVGPVKPVEPVIKGKSLILLF
jgi:hypothetical protein